MNVLSVVFLTFGFLCGVSSGYAFGRASALRHSARKTQELSDRIAVSVACTEAAREKIVEIVTAETSAQARRAARGLPGRGGL